MEFHGIVHSGGILVVRVPTTGSDYPLSIEGRVLIELDEKIKKLKDALDEIEQNMESPKKIELIIEKALQ